MKHTLAICYYKGLFSDAKPKMDWTLIIRLCHPRDLWHGILKRDHTYLKSDINFLYIGPQTCEIWNTKFQDLKLCLFVLALL